VYLNGLLLGIPRHYIKEKFDEIIHFAEVSNFVDQKLKNFSSGMKMRLAFAIAMHTRADIFLIDEIFAVGDYSFQQKSLAALKNKFKNKTAVFVSHDLAQLKQHCQKIMWLEGGKIKKIGKPHEVVREYIHYVSGN
jgi:ABC-type polysaccharide/polyol phosphate transport system ATPase subunit